MFQDFGAKALIADHTDLPANGSLEEAANLIGRYPKLSEGELERLVVLYRGLSALDTALMISDEDLAPKFGQFFDDHRSRLRTPFRQYAVLVAIAVAGFALVIWTMAFAS